jgi:hypothetical protein
MIRGAGESARGNLRVEAARKKNRDEEKSPHALFNATRKPIASRENSCDQSFATNRLQCDHAIRRLYVIRGTP